MRIKTKQVLEASILVLLVVMGLSLIVYLSLSHDIEERVLRVSKDSATNISEQVKRFVNGVEEHLSTWSNLTLVPENIEVDDADGVLQSLFENLNRSYKFVSQILCVNANHTVLASTNPTYLGKPLRESWFTELINSPLRFNSFDHSTPLYMGKEVFLEGQSIGWLLVEVNLHGKGGNREHSLAGLLDPAYFYAGRGQNENFTLLSKRSTPILQSSSPLPSTLLAAFSSQGIKQGIQAFETMVPGFGDALLLSSTELPLEITLRGFVAKTRYQKEIDTALERIFISALILWLLAIAVAWTSAERNRRILTRLVQDAEDIVRGKLQSQKDKAKVSGDEFGDLELAIFRISENLAALFNTVDLNWESVAKAQADVRVMTDKYREAFERVNQHADQLATSATELDAVSTQLVSGSEETAAQAVAASSASEEVSVNVQNVATSADQLSESIKEISRNTSEASLIARESVDLAEQAHAEVGRLGENSEEIGKVIKLITSIAEQTNLLALNATIEAARAGDAGRGFAVVANEVKDLALESGRATDEIASKINSIQSSVANMVQAITKILKIVQRISDVQVSVANAVEEQSSTTVEISRTVADSATGTTEIARNVTGVSESARSTCEGAEKTQSASREMSEMSVALQNLVISLQRDHEALIKSVGK